MIDTSIGEQYKDMLCEVCRDKIVAMTAQITWKDKLHPLRVARRFQAAICDGCRNKIMEKMRRQQ